jgi:hypothetical protein
MEQVVPWAELQGLVEPHYPKRENGRPPVGLSIMLRVYFLQQWFNLSDPGAEDALQAIDQSYRAVQELLIALTPKICRDCQ